jgi:hypothetical protein
VNLWKRFKALIPGDPLQVGEVIGINSIEQTSTVTLLGGGTLVVRGADVPLGQRCYVRGGVIEGQAPDLGAPIALEV